MYVSVVCVVHVCECVCECVYVSVVCMVHVCMGK